MSRKQWLIPAKRLAAATLLGMAAAFLAAGPCAAGGNARLARQLGKLPLAFEPNRGQAESGARYVARGGSFALLVGPTGAELKLFRREPVAPDPDMRERSGPRHSATIRMKLLGARETAPVAAEGRLPGTVSYFRGNDPNRWIKHLPTYARVRCREVYRGVDLLCYGRQNRLEYDLVVRPGADVSRIALAFEGAGKARLDARGDLLLETSLGAVRWRKPVAYQDINGRRREVASRYVLHPRNRISFQLAAYDTHRPLVIDPTLEYCTIGFGGEALALDTNGNAYITGKTAENIFVGVLDTTGSKLALDTYIVDAGGYGDRGCAIALALASDGNLQSVWVAGHAQSPEFPAVPEGNPFAVGRGDGWGACILKFVPDPDNPTGLALAYSTCVGGRLNEEFTGIALDGDGGVYLTGRTQSDNIFQSPSPWPAPLYGFAGGETDAFVMKFDDSSGSPVPIYSTYLGGEGKDDARAIAVDANGCAYITGPSYSTTFRGLNGSLVTGLGAFFTKLEPDLTVEWSLLGVGGSAIALDGGWAYVAGNGNGSTMKGVNRIGVGGSEDAYVQKVDTNTHALLCFARFGGSYPEYNMGVVVDTFGNVHITGSTTSFDLPTADPIQATSTRPRKGGSAYEAYTAALSPDLQLLFSTYLGSTEGLDYAYGIAVSPAAGQQFTPTNEFPFVQEYFTGQGTPPPTAGAYVGPIGYFTARIRLSLGPGVLTASAISRSQVCLNWINRLAYQDGVFVERSTDGKTFTRIMTTAGSNNTYTDSSLAKGTTYWYRIRGFLDTSTTQICSEYSNVVSVKTPPR